MWFFVLFIQVLYAGAWTEPKGSFFILPQLGIEKGNRFTDYKGKTHKVNTFEKQFLGIYAEYGVKSDATLGMRGEVTHLQQKGKPGPDEISTLGDTDIWFRKLFFNHWGFPLSLQGLVVLPGIYKAKETALRPGDGQVQAEIKMYVGISNLDYFAEIGTGPRTRLGSAGDEWRTEITAGIHKKDWITSLHLYDVHSLAPLKDTIYNGNSTRLLLDIVTPKHIGIGIFQDLFVKQRLKSQGLMIDFWGHW